MHCLQVQDKKKIEAEEPVFGLASVDLVEVDAPTWHIAEHLPAIRYSIHPLSILPSVHLSIHTSILPSVIHSFMHGHIPPSSAHFVLSFLSLLHAFLCCFIYPFTIHVFHAYCSCTVMASFIGSLSGSFTHQKSIHSPGQPFIHALKNVHKCTLASWYPATSIDHDLSDISCCQC